MSSILKALQRLEKDRAGARDHEPALSGELSGELATPEEPPGRARTGRWLGLGLALVLAAGGAWLGAPWLAARLGGTPPVVVAEAPPPEVPISAAPSVPPRAQVAKTPPPVAAPAARSPRRPAEQAAQPSPFQENAAETPSALPAQLVEKRASAQAPPAPSTPPVQAQAPPSSPAPVQAKAPPPSSPPPVQAKAPPPPSPAPVQAKAPPPSSPAPVQAKAPPPSSPAPVQAKAPPPSSPAPVQAKAPPPSSPAPVQAKAPPPSTPPVQAKAAPSPSPAKPTPSASAKPARSPVASKPSVASKPAGLAPELAVLRTSWHPSPDRRLARVRVTAGGVPREMREGETDGALHVVKIEPSAVVFTFQGQEIRRTVGR